MDKPVSNHEMKKFRGSISPPNTSKEESDYVLAVGDAIAAQARDDEETSVKAVKGGVDWTEEDDAWWDYTDDRGWEHDLGFLLVVF